MTKTIDRKSSDSKKACADVRRYAYSGEAETPTKAGYEQWAVANNATPIEELFDLYGSWRGTCEASGLRRPRGAPPQGTKEEAIQSLRRARVDLGPAYSQRTYDRWAHKHKAVSLTSILRLWGVWSSALADAGVAATRQRRIEAGPALEAEIRRTCEENGGPLSVRGFNAVKEPGVPSAGRIADHYENGWNEALYRSGVIDEAHYEVLVLIARRKA